MLSAASAKKRGSKDKNKIVSKVKDLFCFSLRIQKKLKQAIVQAREEGGGARELLLGQNRLRIFAARGG